MHTLLLALSLYSHACHIKLPGGYAQNDRAYYYDEVIYIYIFIVINQGAFIQVQNFLYQC